ncbi:MAG TPA: 50S ribosomal protein L32 [Armatimonadota bacterium]|nr:50S ribosomal protein L32 [Armatimonadota bacterium]
MPLPKRRHSKQRTRTRRATWFRVAPSLSRCRQCHSLKRNHAVCKNCGYYAGRQIVEVGERKQAA